MSDGRKIIEGLEQAVRHSRGEDVGAVVHTVRVTMPDSPRHTDYDHLTREGADWLSGASLLPHEFRVLALQRYARERGQAALIDLFAAFIGLANSVVENGRAHLIDYLVHLGHDPQSAQHLNLASIFGALQGIKLADGVKQDGLCHGCAFRRGTAANQSPDTTHLADLAKWPDEGPFWCHEHMDAKGEPTRACKGYARMMQARKERDDAR